MCAYIYTYKMFRPYVHMQSQPHTPLTKTSERKVKASAFHCAPAPNITSPQTYEISHKNRRHLSLTGKFTSQ